MNEKQKKKVTISIQVDSEIEKKAEKLAQEANLRLSELFAKLVLEQESASDNG